MIYTRRDFIKAGFLAGCSFCGSLRANERVFSGAAADPNDARPLFGQGEYKRIDAQERVYHISCSPDMFDQYEDLAEIWSDAGVSDAWLCTWFYGYFPYAWEKIDHCLALIRKAGLRPHFISVPFCHGSGALDPRTEGFPNLPPEHWKTVKRWDGTEQLGFSGHEPTDSEGARAIRTLYDRYGVFDYFLDDDFRFAASPGVIGGCVCDQCRSNFLTKFGYSQSQWNDILDDVRNSSDTPYLRAWVDFFCDRMTQCFHAYQSAVPEVDLGIMVMYMGCERAGIRLDDYRNALFRVGEGCFSDGWYGSTKNKTIELYSSLFHRRFCQPGRAFSETTVFPERSLSAVNMASKLAISTICDVRNTCFMSGLVPIDPGHWSIIGERMKRERELHTKLIGARLSGPFKHYYGVSSRYCSGENAYSLFLAMGINGEVQPAHEETTDGLQARAGQNAFGRTAGADVEVDARTRNSRRDGAEHIAVADEADACAGCANLFNDRIMATALQDAHVDVAHRLAELFAQILQVLSNRVIDMQTTAAIGCCCDLPHVGIGCEQKRAARSDGNRGQRIRLIGSAQIRTFQRIDGDVDLLATATELLADVEHGRLVAFTFADNNATREIDVVDGSVHGVRNQQLFRSRAARVGDFCRTAAAEQTQAAQQAQHRCQSLRSREPIAVSHYVVSHHRF